MAASRSPAAREPFRRYLLLDEGDPRRHQPRPIRPQAPFRRRHPPPFAARASLSGAERRRARSCIAGRDASVPLQVVNETDLSPVPDALSAGAIVARGHCLSPTFSLSLSFCG